MQRPPRDENVRPAIVRALGAIALLAACSGETPKSVPNDAPASPSFGSAAAVGASDSTRDPATPYFEFEVEQPATTAAGVATPAYPEALRKDGVSGLVLVQFIVDTSGRAEPASFKVLKTSHEAMAAAVKAALPGMRFVPAQDKGVKVRQLAQQPFVFALER